MKNNITQTFNENPQIYHIIPLLYGYFEANNMTWMNGSFLLDVRIKLFYTDDICPLNSYYIQQNFGYIRKKWL
jgi:hypothetical protein